MMFKNFVKIVDQKITLKCDTTYKGFPLKVVVEVKDELPTEFLKTLVHEVAERVQKSHKAGELPIIGACRECEGGKSEHITYLYNVEYEYCNGGFYMAKMSIKELR